MYFSTTQLALAQEFSGFCSCQSPFACVLFFFFLSLLEIPLEIYILGVFTSLQTLFGFALFFLQTSFEKASGRQNDFPDGFDCGGRKLGETPESSKAKS